IQFLIDELYKKVIKAYVNRDMLSLREANEIEDQIDSFTEHMAQSHIERIDQGVCTSEIGAQYMSLASNAERVADHFINIAETIRNYRWGKPARSNATSNRTQSTKQTNNSKKTKGSKQTKNIDKTKK
ncbi:MAG: hypothetical protein K2M36_05795, partial [Clostridia bacterium]|nr:hypothetical protein [Clostridia bacterium]